MVLCVAMLLSAGGFALAAEEPLFDPEVLQTDLQAFIYLKGSWFEMGEQYARQVPYAIQREYAKSMANLTDMCGGAEKARDYAWIFLNYLGQECPQLYQFVQGAAAGMGWAVIDAAIGMLYDSAPKPATAQAEQERESCMNIAAWGQATAQGHLLVASNSDQPVYHENTYQSGFIMFPDDGHAVVTAFGPSCNAYMNDQGVVTLGSAGQNGRPEDVNTKWLCAFLYPLYILSQCDTAQQVLDYYLNQEVFTKICNTHIVDRNGNDFVIERTAAHYAVRSSGDFGETDYAIATNDFMTEEMQCSLYNDGSFDDCRPRYWTAERILLDNYGKANIGTLASAVGSRRYYVDGQWSDVNWDDGRYMYFSPEGADSYFKTMQRTLFDANDLQVYRLMGGSDVYNSAIAYSTGKFCRVVLAGGVAQTNANAEKDARQMIWYASRDLAQAQARDLEKEEYLNMAKAEYQKGCSYTALARYEEAMGGETQALFHYGKATSKHCLAQQYAQAAQINDNSFTKPVE